MTTTQKNLIKKSRFSAKLFIINVSENIITIKTGKSGSNLKKTTHTYDSNESATQIAYDLIYKKFKRGFVAY